MANLVRARLVTDRHLHPCEECGMEIPDASDRCYRCKREEGRNATLADFGGGLGGT